ncbi:MAG: 1-acyl-sn-glycerol-3-phosphate acyltransferase [Planctomycetaceae bacterium]|nr:1-acyl-sn-glycerol-3-phosphate acyltransferase [Planctomycetaceae bacterium]MCA9045215.1 1-acyl-sn-glycerol-3-phosphate acyltransferase [Planctomycetaceae bacterium]
MNRQPFQTPPHWWESKLNRWWVWLCRPYRLWELTKKQQVDDVTLQNAEVVIEAQRRGQGVLITPNHSTHYDSNCLFTGLEPMGVLVQFMTAWQVFGMSHPFVRWSLQRHGCFSVDREATDLRAFRHAISLLHAGAAPLVIFPEGDIHHSNDRVMPFREGPAAIALTAARKSPRDLVAIPCAIKFHYVGDPTESLKTVLARIERRILLRPATDLDFVDRILRIARTILCIKEVEEFGHVQHGDIQERIQHLARSVLRRISEAFERPDSEAPIPEVVKDLRRRTIAALEEAEVQDAEEERLRHHLEDLFFATQLYSYPGNYLRTNPTRERIAETVDKLEEDVLDVALPTVHARRKVTIRFGDPILIEREEGKKGRVQELTGLLETKVQQLLDEINGA